MASIAIKYGGGETLYCAIAWAMKGGSGVPKQGGCLQTIMLIIVQRLELNKYLVKANPGEARP